MPETPKPDNPDTPVTSPTATDTTTTTQTTTQQQTTNTQTSTQTLTAKDKLQGTGVYMNHKYALVDEDVKDGIITTNAGKYKISIFLSPKFTSSDKIFTSNSNIFLKYNDTVRLIHLVDDIDSIGLSGYIDVNNIGSHLDLFLERHNNYYLIINFTKYQDVNNNEVATVKFQPYIFEIDRIQSLSNPQAEIKTLRIWLVDLVTKILKTHSIASVIKMHRNITKCQSYKEVFGYIMEYVRNYINVNTNNKYEYHKPLLYTNNTYCFGIAKNGNDVGVQMSGLIKASFKKVSKNASIKEALDILLQDCCTSLKTPAGFKERYMNIGDVLIPFFFKEEYPDPQLLYSSIWTNGEPLKTGEESTSSNSSSTTTTPTTNSTPTQTGTTGVADSSSQSSPTTSIESGGESDKPVQEVPADTSNSLRTKLRTTPQTQTTSTSSSQTTTSFWDRLKGGVSKLISKKKNQESILFDTAYGGSANVLVNRQMTMRDIYMPFFIAFGTQNYTCVYQDINPSKNNVDDNILSILGVYQGDLKSFQFNPIDLNSVSKLWKNVIFLDGSDGAVCTNSTLIFFSWFFDYFQQVFLNSNEKPLTSNVMPDFFMFGRNQGINHAKGQDDTFENKFDEFNSYTYATQTDDSVKECLRVMGKNIASFTLINDSYTFTLNGNLFRRPNEIIRLGYRGNKENQGMQMLSYFTGLNFNDMTYLYVKRVTHTFAGSTYDNTIQGCKICEVFDFENKSKQKATLK